MGTYKMKNENESIYICEKKNQTITITFDNLGNFKSFSVTKLRKTKKEIAELGASYISVADFEEKLELVNEFIKTTLGTKQVVIPQQNVSLDI